MSREQDWEKDLENDWEQAAFVDDVVWWRWFSQSLFSLFLFSLSPSLSLTSLTSLTHAQSHTLALVLPLCVLFVLSLVSSHGDALRDEMVSAFDMLEKLVKEGLTSLHAEHGRQVRVRRENQSALESSLKSISAAYASEVSKQLAVERQREKTEERAFELLEARTVAEREQAIMVSTLQYEGRKGADEPKIACQ